MPPHLTVEQRQLALRLKARGLSLREIGPQAGAPLLMIFARRQDCLAREDRPAGSCRRGHRGCVTAGTASGRVRG